MSDSEWLILEKKFDIALDIANFLNNSSIEVHY